MDSPETTTPGVETTFSSVETTTLEEEDATFNWKARGVKRKRKKTVTTTETPGKALLIIKHYNK